MKNKYKICVRKIKRMGVRNFTGRILFRNKKLFRNHEMYLEIHNIALGYAKGITINTL